MTNDSISHISSESKKIHVWEKIPLPGEATEKGLAFSKLRNEQAKQEACLCGCSWGWVIALRSDSPSKLDAPWFAMPIYSICRRLEKEGVLPTSGFSDGEEIDLIRLWGELRANPQAWKIASELTHTAVAAHE